MMPDVFPVCRVCGHCEHRKLYVVDGCMLLECVNCGFRFPQTVPSHNLLQEHYAEGYGEQKHIRGQKVNARINRLILRKALGDLRNYKILDVGAGYGFFCYSLEQIKGSCCDGLEISKIQKTFAEEVLGLRVFCGFEEIAEQYDLIVSFEVLEHILDPHGFLNEVSKFLKPGGSIVLATDNFKSVSVERMQSFFPKWIPHEHVSCFSPMSIRKLFDGLPSLEFVSLKTYASWELRLASVVLQIKKVFGRVTNVTLDSSCRGVTASQLSSKTPGHGKYKFYRLRLILSPLFAWATFSPAQSGEMMVVRVKKIE